MAGRARVAIRNQKMTCEGNFRHQAPTLTIQSSG